MQSKSILRSTHLRSPRKSVRFMRPVNPLAHSLSSNVRTPYPSAPLSPTEGDGQWTKDRDLDDVTSRPRSLSLSTINRAKKPAPLNLESRLTASSITRPKKPVPLDLESRLSEDFWQSLTLKESAKSDDDDEPMVTALEYPESPVQYDYAALQSPGIPRPVTILDRNSLMSPGIKSSLGRVVRKDFTAPSPNDPFAAFPSFAAVLAMGSSEGATLWSR